MRMLLGLGLVAVLSRHLYAADVVHLSDEKALQSPASRYQGDYVNDSSDAVVLGVSGYQRNGKIEAVTITLEPGETFSPQDGEDIDAVVHADGSATKFWGMFGGFAVFQQDITKEDAESSSIKQYVGPAKHQIAQRAQRIAAARREREKEAERSREAERARQEEESRRQRGDGGRKGGGEGPQLREHRNERPTPNDRSTPNDRPRSSPGERTKVSPGLG